MMCPLVENWLLGIRLPTLLRNFYVRKHITFPEFRIINIKIYQ
jgi:hypothetical protein